VPTEPGTLDHRRNGWPDDVPQQPALDPLFLFGGVQSGPEGEQDTGVVGRLVGAPPRRRRGDPAGDAANPPALGAHPEVVAETPFVAAHRAPPRAGSQ